MASLNALFGAMLVGVILCSSLLGVLTVQVCGYYARFKNDPLWMKSWIAAVYVVDLLHQLFGSWLSYRYAISIYTCPTCLGRVHWSVGVIALLEPLSAALTQLWFARRLYQFNKNQMWLVILTVALSIMSMVAGLASAIIIFSRQTFAQFGGKDTWHVTIWFAAGFLCDVLVTVPVAWSLYRSRTGFRTTDRLMTRLAIWVINTGALTATFALLVTALFLVYPHTLVYVSLNLILASLYSNSLVAFLNRRGRWENGLRRDSHIHWTTTFPLSRLRRHVLNASDPSSKCGSEALSSNTGLDDQILEERTAEDDFWGRDQWDDPCDDLVPGCAHEAHDPQGTTKMFHRGENTIRNPSNQRTHGTITVDIEESQYRS